MSQRNLRIAQETLIPIFWNQNLPKETANKYLANCEEEELFKPPMTMWYHIAYPIHCSRTDQQYHILLCSISLRRPDLGIRLSALTGELLCALVFASSFSSSFALIFSRCISLSNGPQVLSPFLFPASSMILSLLLLGGLPVSSICYLREFSIRAYICRPTFIIYPMRGVFLFLESGAVFIQVAIGQSSPTFLLTRGAYGALACVHWYSNKGIL